MPSMTLFLVPLFFICCYVYKSDPPLPFSKLVSWLISRFVRQFKHFLFFEHCEHATGTGTYLHKSLIHSPCVSSNPLSKESAGVWSNYSSTPSVDRHVAIATQHPKGVFCYPAGKFPELWWRPLWFYDCTQNLCQCQHELCRDDPVWMVPATNQSCASWRCPGGVNLTVSVGSAHLKASARIDAHTWAGEVELSLKAAP